MQAVQSSSAQQGNPKQNAKHGQQRKTETVSCLFVFFLPFRLPCLSTISYVLAGPVDIVDTVWIGISIVKKKESWFRRTTIHGGCNWPWSYFMNQHAFMSLIPNKLNSKAYKKALTVALFFYSMLELFSGTLLPWLAQQRFQLHII